MIIAMLFGLFYVAMVVGSIVGIIYFIIKRQEEKKEESDALNNDNY